ncbi:MAG: toprim domain-containing protein [Candidatus Aenigmarchaeota archaeon]|nr:toprim domain-containing protein [Candidatus Aenigmarchaeota archaeon]
MKRRLVRTFIISQLIEMDEYKEELLHLLNELKSLRVIVEGRKDKISLEELGFKKIVVLNNYSGFFDVVSKIKDEEVLILTDFDPEGEEIAKKIRGLLIKMGKNVDVRDRKKLRKLFIKNKLSTVEGLKRLF